MSNNDAVPTQLMRSATVMRDLQVAIARIDNARKGLSKDHPLSALAEELAFQAEGSAVEKWLEILTRINSWLAVEVQTLNRTAAIIEKEPKP